MQLFVSETAALVVQLSQFFACAPSDVLQSLPPDVSAEWADFFVEGIYSQLLPLAVKITGWCLQL